MSFVDKVWKSCKEKFGKVVGKGLEKLQEKVWRSCEKSLEKLGVSLEKCDKSVEKRVGKCAGERTPF